MINEPASIQTLARLLAVFSLHGETEVRSTVIETAAESFDAPIVGIRRDGATVDSVGLADDDHRLAELDVGYGRSVVEIEGWPSLNVLCLPFEDDGSCSLILARAHTPFGAEDSMVARAMLRIMREATRTIEALNQANHTAAELAEQVDANRRMAARIKERHEGLLLRVMSIQAMVTTAAPEEQTLQEIVEQAGELFNGDVVSIKKYGAEPQIWTSNLDKDAERRLAKLGPTAGLSGRAMSEGRLVVNRRYKPLTFVSGESTRSAMSVPIYSRGEIVGTMAVVGSERRNVPHDEEDQEVLAILAGYVSVALTEEASSKQLHDLWADAEWRANHDSLTGLPNRTQIISRIHADLAAGISTVVLYLDVDGFKTINDLHGHVVGDHALIAVAQRLQMATRSGEIVGRLSGDEFVVLLPPAGREEVMATARRLSSSLQAPYNIGGQWLMLPASIGVAMIQAETAEELLESADLAMYAAKASQDERISMFDERLGQQRTRRVQLEQQLRLAVVDMEQFSLVYQPIVGCTDFEITALEALLRWDNPVLGKVGPDEFISVAEDTGLVSRLDDWVLDTVLRNRKERTSLTVPVSVNLSAASFLRPDLRGQVAGALDHYGLAGSSLTVEITERVMLGDPIMARTNIQALQDLAVAVLLDDFGTGYSSLSYLRDFKVDGMKIDRSLVNGAKDDPRGQAVLRAMVGLANDLGSELVAEGVETLDDLENLRELGCCRFQGYLFSKPLAIDELKSSVERSLSEMTRTTPLS